METKKDPPGREKKTVRNKWVNVIRVVIITINAKTQHNKNRRIH